MQVHVLWSVLLTRLFSGLAMVFPSPLNTVKTDDRCVNVWSVPVGVLMVVCLEILILHKCTYVCRNTSSLP